MVSGPHWKYNSDNGHRARRLARGLMELILLNIGLERGFPFCVIAEIEYVRSL
jgi:hypothetical protein